MEVPVGDYLPDGTFVGEQAEFDGREVGVYNGLYTDLPDPGDAYGFILRLYECPDGYRVHELLWPVVPGRSASASLFPAGGDEDPEAYTEQEVREGWAPYFQSYFESI